ncbi:Anti-sigma regulatory factor (Ser/Thr protein kinase) [Parafrankia irregularis]|uniref:Anti-sigma regulatory factor (Ser/Thr protein kinase) n=1 Tax=Parafrankia irregularis TaxID=795642 RepID=A0A0S4QZB8_9ACTN|nr:MULTISPECIES: ATP-binding protein [Frankiaceae]KPM53149.1 anti-sigma factor [Frankia sp. R43]MBE3204674.1 ATP-binding protein [Parafrankia sp. CH37]CUU60612.1 Anti-sigma regulatory factor (Ser/Thr protein kinase) [Parafrankia irregularis]
MNLPSAACPQPTAHLRASVHQFTAITTAPALARGTTAHLLDSWGLPDLIETSTLLVSEIVTNAVRATETPTYPGPAVIAMRISWTASSLIIEVWDRNPAPPVLQTQYVHDENGRGLHVVEALSIAAAYYPAPTGQGKVTWCQIEAPILAQVEEPRPLLPRRCPSVARADPGMVFDDLAVLARVRDSLRALDVHLPRM